MNTFATFGAFKPKEGKEEELLAVLTDAARSMSSYEGCEEYRVYRDDNGEGLIWVSEVWTSEEAHKNCLQDPVVRESITKGMPLIEEMPHRYKLIPVEA